MPVTIESPTPVAPPRAPDTARVAVVRTRPETVIEDYGRVMALAGYQRTLARDVDTLLKLNLSWTKYFPACSSQPWQVDGVLTHDAARRLSAPSADSASRTRPSSRVRARDAATTGGSRCWRGTA